MFAQGMIPHHEQAIEMADIALDPTIGAGPEVIDLAARIKAGQDPEIEQMTAWLTAWGASTDTGHGDVDHLLPEYEKLLAQIASTRAALKQELHHALTATAGTAE